LGLTNGLRITRVVVESFYQFSRNKVEEKLSKVYDVAPASILELGLRQKSKDLSVEMQEFSVSCTIKLIIIDSYDVCPKMWSESHEEKGYTQSKFHAVLLTIKSGYRNINVNNPECDCKALRQQPVFSTSIHLVALSAMRTKGPCIVTEEAEWQKITVHRVQ